MKNLSLLSGLIFAALLLFSACSADDAVDPDPTDRIVESASYLVFGHYYGRRPAEDGIEIFKIEDSKLYEDTNDHYPTPEDFYKGNFVELSAEKYAQVSDLMDVIPAQLLEETETVIGLPDAGDWGGLYVEYYAEGAEEADFWLIDMLEANRPEYLNPFVNQINKKIEMINAGKD